ncbi:Notchless 1 [Nymphon striatum]|nr:Notchless 1 [Nymphon striatum]
MEIDEDDGQRILSQFKSETGELLCTPFDLQLDLTVDKLQLLCNALLKKDEVVPYLFHIDDVEITDNLGSALADLKLKNKEEFNSEKVLEITYQPQAVFRVCAVTRCTSSLPGHAEAVISASFTSGSGDTTVRFWDTMTQTPQFTCKGHKHWVLCIAWSPDGKKLASACKNGQICIWNPQSGKQMGKTLIGHRQWITFLSWEPLHRNSECRRLVSSSKDTTLKIWDIVLGQAQFTLGGHTQSVTCVRWGGSGLIYSGSQDRTIKVWRSEDGALCRTLQGHAHWVNTLTLNTDYAIRTCCEGIIHYYLCNFNVKYKNLELLICEMLISGSDDFTMYLWQPENDRKPITRMTGHQQVINDVKFSPDMRLIASASFDKSVKIWDGKTGKYIASLRGHVQAVYNVSWSADSRLLVSGSADSTLKVWDIKTKKLNVDLPGHADEVYAVDWSPDGTKVVSGGKDKVLKL